MCNLTSQTELHLICCICSVPVHFTAPSMALHSHEFTSYNSSFLPVLCIWSVPSLNMIKMLYGIPNANVFWQVHFATLPTVWSIILHHFIFSLPCRQLWLGYGVRLGYFRVRRTHENPKKKNQIREQAQAPHVRTQSPMLLQKHVGGDAHSATIPIQGRLLLCNCNRIEAPSRADRLNIQCQCHLSVQHHLLKNTVLSFFLSLSHTHTSSSLFFIGEISWT